MKKYIIGVLLTVLSCSVLADSNTSTESSSSSDVGTTYTIKPGYKYFRISCGDFNSVYTKEYTVSKDKKEISTINDDGEWVQFINSYCKITMVKP